MAEHGVALPTEAPGERHRAGLGEGATARPTPDESKDPAREAARQACASLLPAHGLRAPGFHDGVDHQFRACMHRHGVELPRQEQPGTPPPGEGPTPGPDTGRGGLLAGLDLNNPVVHKAVEDCRSILIDNRGTAVPETSAAP
jgi:hypothetical protein